MPRERSAAETVHARLAASAERWDEVARFTRTVLARGNVAAASTIEEARALQMRALLHLGEAIVRIQKPQIGVLHRQCVGRELLVHG